MSTVAVTARVSAMPRATLKAMASAMAAVVAVDRAVEMEAREMDAVGRAGLVIPGFWNTFVCIVRTAQTVTHHHLLPRLSPSLLPCECRGSSWIGSVAKPPYTVSVCQCLQHTHNTSYCTTNIIINIMSKTGDTNSHVWHCKLSLLFVYYTYCIHVHNPNNPY